MNSCSQPRKNLYGLLLLNLRIQLSWLGMWSPAKLLRHIFTPTDKIHGPSFQGKDNIKLTSKATPLQLFRGIS